MPKDRVNKKSEEVKDLEPISNPSIFVKAKEMPVRIRLNPGIDSPVVAGKYLDNTAMEVSEVVPGKGSKKGWGKLSDGSGWVGMDFVERVNK